MTRELLTAIAVSVLGLLTGCKTAETAAAPKNYHKTIYKCTCEMDQLGAWELPKGSSFHNIGQHNFCLKVTAEKPGRHLAQTPIPFSQYRGQSITIKSRIKAENVTKPKNYWNGVKLMASYDSPLKGTQWKNITEVYGTFDWKDYTCSFLVEPDAEDGYLLLGLEECTGTAWFDDMEVTMTDKDALFKKYVPDGFKCEYSPELLNAERYRGCMSPASFTATTLNKDLPDLRSWGANIIRWQLIREWHKRNNNQDRDEYLQWVSARIPEIRQVLDKCQELGMKVVLDLHVAPGGRSENGHMNMFNNKEFADTFEMAWKLLAKAAKGHPALYGYDLINEPSQAFEVTLCDYLELQYRVAKTVRAIDPETPIIIESNGWDNAADFSYLTPLPMKNVIYQAHMYHPGAFTHQGVGVSKNYTYTPIAYPNEKRNWNKEALRKHLKPLVDFQKKYGAKIFIGEFSACRWAQGAEIYLQDCIDLFEEYGWDWTFHAFRESPTWSVEMEGSDYRSYKPAVQDTPRKQVLLKGFMLNK